MRAQSRNVLGQAYPLVSKDNVMRIDAYIQFAMQGFLFRGFMPCLLYGSRRRPGFLAG